MASTEWIEEARQHEKKQDWGEAAAAYEQALMYEPANVQVHNDLGAVYEHLQQLDQAERHYRLALQHDPDLVYAHYNLGKLLKSRGRVEEAQVEFEEFLSLTANPAEIAEGKALLKEVTGLSYAKCAGCGHISVLERFFKPSARGQLCPPCYARHQSKNSRITLLTSLAVVVLCYGMLLAQSAVATMRWSI